MENYRKLVNETNSQKYVQENYVGRFKQMKKTQILNATGRGITFLLSDISILFNHLNLLLAEFNGVDRAWFSKV